MNTKPLPTEEELRLAGAPILAELACLSYDREAVLAEIAALIREARAAECEVSADTMRDDADADILLDRATRIREGEL